MAQFGSMRKSLTLRISAEHLQDYMDRKLSSAQIARLYGVKSIYVTRTLPKRPKVEPPEKSQKARLRSVRMEYRDHLAKQVLSKTLKPAEVAAKAHVSLRT